MLGYKVMNIPNKKQMRKTGLFISSAEFMDKLGYTEIYEQHRKQVKTMEKNKKIAHLDTGVKGAAVGLLTYVGVQQGWSAEVIAALVPVASVVLSFVSSKIGDKNTTLLLKLAVQAVEAAPVKKAVKKAPVKKAK
jgi:VIT1/CCC1 family predicted Fe2+/Mn2+ transporter